MVMNESDANLWDARRLILQDGLAMVPGANLMAVPEIGYQFTEIAQMWANLPIDPYYTGAKPSRFRRHAQLRLDADTGALEWLPNKGYFQSLEYNQLFGGITRHFAVIEQSDVVVTFLASLIGLASENVFNFTGTWLINVHFVRTVSDSGSITPPAPEGPHRDGYDFISLHLISRNNDRGGETVIMDQAYREVFRLELADPLDTVYMDDRKFRHDVIPISSGDRSCHRDMILMSYERP
jgi:hypothetical protein